MDSKLDNLKQLLEKKSQNNGSSPSPSPMILGKRKKDISRRAAESVEGVMRNSGKGQQKLIKLPMINNRGNGRAPRVLERKRMPSQDIQQFKEEEEADINVDDLLENALDARKKQQKPQHDQEPKDFQDQSSSLNPAQSIASLRKKKMLRNIIIMKGQTLSKQDIYKMKSYFDKISNHNKAITIQDFQNFFTGERSHMKSDLTSIFNFLDKQQKGKVTFLQLLLRIYPQLPREYFKLINEWIMQFQKILSREQKSVIYQDFQQQEKKEQESKKPAPFPVIQTIKEIFDTYDTEKKGYLTFENMRQKLYFGYTQFELEDVFKRFDTDNDGKMQFEDFLRFILPKEFTFDLSEKQTQLLNIKRNNSNNTVNSNIDQQVKE